MFFISLFPLANASDFFDWESGFGAETDFPEIEVYVIGDSVSLHRFTDSDSSYEIVEVFQNEKSIKKFEAEVSGWGNVKFDTNQDEWDEGLYEFKNPNHDNSSSDYLVYLIEPINEYSRVTNVTSCLVNSIYEYEQMTGVQKMDVFARCDPVHAFDCRFALEYYDKLLEKPSIKENSNPYISILEQKGFCLGWLEKYEKELDVYEELLYLDPDNLDAAIEKGTTLLILEQYSEAENIFNQVLLKDENNFYALVGIGRVEYAYGNPATAIEWYDEALSIHPDWKWVLSHKADALMQIGHTDIALDLYTETLVDSPDQHRALLGKGNALLDLNRLAEAETYFQRALDVKPSSEEAMNKLNFIRTQNIETEVRQLDLEVELLKWITIMGTIASVLSLVWAIRRRNQHKQLNQSLGKIEEKIDKLSPDQKKSSAV